MKRNINTEAHIHAHILTHETHKHTPTWVYLIPQNTKVGDLEMELQQKYSILGYIQNLLIYMVHCFPDIETVNRKHLLRAVALDSSSMLSCSIPGVVLT